MIDPVNATNVAVQLTAEQIQGAVQDKVIGLLVSLGLTGIGVACGAGVKNAAGKIIGMILGILGLLGTIGFTLALLDLSRMMI